MNNHISSINNLMKKKKIEGGLFLFSFLILLFFMIYPPANGDSYSYARSIVCLEGTPIHAGYYVIGAAVHYFLKFFGVTPLMTLGLLSVFFGSICVVFMYIFIFRLTADRMQSVLASLILMFSGAFFFYSVHGEVYIPQLAFVLLSAISIEGRKLWPATLFIAIAISIATTSILAIPALLYLMHTREAKKKEMVFFVLPVFLLVIVLFLCDNAKFSDMLAQAICPPKVFLGKFTLAKLMADVLYRLVKVYGRSFNLISILSLCGFFIALKNHRMMAMLSVMFLLPFLMYIFNLGLFSGDHLIISFIAISCLGAYALVYLTKRLSRGRYAVFFLLLLIHAVLSQQLFIAPEKRNAEEVSRVVRVLKEVFPEDGILFSEYAFGEAFWYLTAKENDYYIFAGLPNRFLKKHCRNYEECRLKFKNKFWFNISSNMFEFFAMAKNANEIFEGRDIYFADLAYWPSTFIKALLSERSIETREEQRASLKQFKKILEIKNIKIEKIIDSPLCPVYKLRKSDGNSGMNLTKENNICL
ncbi:MAG: DUF2723 domain-containing protein [Candidatus Omnitrophica bacterium]|nr:DUF2723 domain-containing protein [Candidatus Omnitrophota bacterium]